MRQDLGGHANSNTHSTLHCNDRNLRREQHRLFVPSIIGLRILGYLRVIQHLLRKGFKPAFYVPASSCAITGKEVSEVSLLLYEELTVRKIYEGLIDRRIAMWMVFHTGADNIGNLHEAAIVHLKERMHDPSLDRLESIDKIRDSPIPDYI